MILPFRSSLDILKFTKSELRNVITDVTENGMALFYGQDMSMSDFSGLSKKIGECETPGLFMNPKDFPEIFIVSNKKNDEGKKIGMFGEGELGWHSNGNSRMDVRQIGVALYCVEPDLNTTLSICNTSLPYYDMCPEEQGYWSEVKIRLEFKNDTIYKLELDDPEFDFMSSTRGSIRNLVGNHPVSGKKYFYFPYGFITKAWHGKKKIDAMDMIEKLKRKIFKSKYQFHHVLMEGDLLIMDQLMTLHRRNQAKSPRVVWRSAFDYGKIMDNES